MNKVYYQFSTETEKNRFWDNLSYLKENCKRSELKTYGEYDYHYYVMPKGIVYLYKENTDYGIPTSLEEIKTMIGVNVNCDKYHFCDWIARGLKTVETRNKPTLRKYVGKRIAIVSTRPGHKEKARVIGYATITKEITYTNAKEFYEDTRHCINRNMKDYRFNKVKYGYVLTDFKPAKGDKMIYTNGIVSRKVEVE